jgi:hypothetical protein
MCCICNPTSVLDPRVYCSVGCRWSTVGNGICDPECQVQSCCYDIHDCPISDPLPDSNPGSDLSEYCAEGCRVSWIGDGECDFECLVDSCSYDLNDCPEYFLNPIIYCAVGCGWSSVGDGQCNPEYLVQECTLDIYYY